MTKDAGLKTVAFPTVGCGKLGYAVDDVISCFQLAAATVDGLTVVYQLLYCVKVMLLSDSGDP